MSDRTATPSPRSRVEGRGEGKWGNKDCRQYWLISVLLICALASSPAHAAPGAVCLELSDIDHTEVADDSTILFDMKDHAVWENLLPEPCAGLKAANGFEYTGSKPRICANSDRIRIVDSDSACALGPFVLNRAR